MTRENPLGSVMVVGAGISGMQASLDLAETGILVHLVEAKSGIGGWMAKLDKTFPTNDCAMCTLAPKLVNVGRHPNIQLYTNTRVTSIEGDVGNFKAVIEEKPRYVDADKCIACGECSEKCPKKIPSEFDKELGTRKAIYTLYPQTVPSTYTIDPDNCIYLLRGKCGVCAKVCKADAVDFEQEPTIGSLEVGAVIITGGYEDVPADLRAEYGWGRFPNVISAPQFERTLSASGPFSGEVLRPSDGEHPRRIAWLQCVGSRDVKRGRPYCSAVCCTYATKEAIIAKEHLGIDGVDCHIYFMDMRTFGKGFEEYYNSAKEDYGVEYTRCRVAELREDPETHDLIVKYEDEAGRLSEESYNLVVLSTGLDPPMGADEFEGVYGVDVDEYGFVKTGYFDPAATSRPGVYAGGVVEGPKDIPDSLAQASAAAASAEAVVGPSRGTEITPIDMPEERDVTTEEPRIGVFVCHCGINIASVVDVKAVADYARLLPGVTLAEDNLYACSQDTQEHIKEVIEELSLNRVIVASCTPRTHEPLFQATINEASLNPFLFELPSLREHCAWVHKDDPAAATAKAKHLVEMAVDKVRRNMPVHKEPAGVKPVGMVIGGGPAGMSASLALAAQGLRCILVERTDKLGGGLLRILHLLEPEDPKKALASLSGRVEESEMVELLLSSELVDLSGLMGNFEATVRTPDGDRTFNVGAIIVATGAKELQPESSYMYGDDPRVMTNLEAGEAMDRGDFPMGGPVVFIQCVESRIPERTYCSRVCCSTTVKNATHIKELSPETEVIVIYRDIRTYSRRELSYRRARELGVLFARYEVDRPPTLSKEGDDLILEYIDYIGQRRVRRKVSTAVLAASMVPHEDNDSIGQMLKVPLTEHNFFLEAHLKIRPMDFATDGIFLAGTCHGPKFLDETIAQGAGAASRAATVLTNPTVITEGLPAWVDPLRCTGCGICEANCPYDAIVVDPEMGVAVVTDVLCKGCGTCAAVCPSGAPTNPQFAKEQIVAMIEDALLPARGGG